MRNVLNKCIVFLLCLCIILPVGLNDAVYAESEIVPVRHLINSGFEVTNTDGTIPGWTIAYGDASISDTMSFNGEGSLVVENVKDSGQGIRVDSDLIDVDEGDTYLFSANTFIETRNIQGFYIYVYDEQGNIVKGATGSDFHAYINVLEPIQDWTFVEQAIHIQPGGKKLKVSLISGNRYNFKFYLDDITILKAIENGNFEQPLLDGSIPGWSKNDVLHGDTFGITDEQVYEGESSLFIKNDPGKHVQVISDFIPVESGEMYTAMAQSFIELRSTDMYVRYFDESGAYIDEQDWSILREPQGVWFTNAVQFVVPENASYAAVLFAGSPTREYKFYIDDVKILKGDHIIEEEETPEDSITIVGEDLGPQIRKATIMRSAAGKDALGNDVIYTVLMGAPAIFTAINIASGEVIDSIPLPETSGAWGVIVSTDGTVYLGAYNLGLLYRYFPDTGEMKNLGHPFATKDSVLYPMGSAPDGKIYGGTYPTGHVYEYDPVSETFTDLGNMSSQTSGERWIRVTVYDPATHKLYMGLGNEPQLVEYNIATGEKRDLLPEKYRDVTAIYDLNIVGGKLFARKETNNPFETFVIDAETGEEVEITNADTGETSFEFINYSRGVSEKSPIANKLYYAGVGGELFEYDLDTDTIQSLGISIEGAAIGYDFVELNEEDFPGYSLVGMSGNSGKMYKYNLETGNVELTDIMLPAEPVNIHDIVKGPDGKIYTGGYLAGNLGVYTPTTGETRYFEGISQSEALTTVGDNLYIGAYPTAKIYEYDLSKPWNRTSGSLNPNLLFSLEKNPDISGYMDQDRPFGLAGSDELNKLFVGTVPKNGMLGGVLAVYDLETRENPEVYFNLIPDQSIVSLVYKDGLVYGGTSIHGGQGSSPTASEAVLFVWDVVNQQKIFETVPVTGKQAITSLHIGPDGNVWGFANGALFIFDPASQEIIYSKDEFPSESNRWLGTSMTTGTDGNVYATVNGRFIKIDAQSKEVTVLATEARKLAQDDFGHFYLYGDPATASNLTSLYKYTIPELIVGLMGAELSIESNTIEVGEQTTLRVKGLLEQGRSTYDLNGASIEYSISDSEVISLDDSTLTGLQAGEVQISVSVKLGEITVESEVITLSVISESSITNLESMLMNHQQSGEISHSMTASLSNAVRQAEHHYRNGRLDQAIQQLDRFIQHLDNSGQAKNITTNAKVSLHNEAIAIKEMWLNL